MATPDRSRTTVERDRLVELYAQRVDSYPTAPPGYATRWRAWCQMLLARAGQLVVPHLEADHNLDALLTGATFTGGDTARMVRGRPSNCHANTAARWAAGRLEAVGTGYALSGDGLWRQHSWGIDRDAIVETTVRRTLYAGIRLEGVDALVFALANDGAAVEAAAAGGGRRAGELLELMVKALAVLGDDSADDHVTEADD